MKAFAYPAHCIHGRVQTKDRVVLHRIIWPWWLPLSDRLIARQLIGKLHDRHLTDGAYFRILIYGKHRDKPQRKLSVQYQAGRVVVLS